jgi:general secretion pathway protein A
MYTRFFGLTRLPFEASPDPSFLFDGPVHREAIASIEYAVATRMGFIMLTGEVGLGKTTVIRAFLDRFDRDRLLPIYVFHPLLSFDDLLELLSDELGLTLDGSIGSFNRLRAIQRELIRLYDAKRQVILVIDEAQRLPEDTLENLRLLTNLETDDAKLLQIVLVGQPELEDVLAQPHLRQLEQRIVLKARLDNLKSEDAVRYLRHRLTLAGADDPEDVLSAATMHAIGDLADGVPRRMNILANRALIDAFGANEKPVTAARVRRVAESNGRKQATIRRQRSWVVPAVVVLAIAAAGLALASEMQHPAAMERIGSLFSAIRSEGEPTAPVAPAQPPSPAPIASPPAMPEPDSRSQPTPPTAETASVPPPAAAAAPPAPPTPASAIVAAAPPLPAPVPSQAPDAPAAKEGAATPAPIDSRGAAIRDTPYTVAPGDTLWKICLQAYGPDMAPSMISKVMSRNRIVSDVKLMWGKTIILPAAGTS